MELTNDSSFADIRAALEEDGGEAPPKEEPKPTIFDAKEEPAAEETPAAPEKEPEPAPVTDPDEPKEPVAETPLPPGVQKRIQKEIDKAVRATKEAERLRDELAAKLREPAPAKEPAAASTPAKPEGKPEIANYSDYDEYNDALMDWKIDQRDKAAAAKETARQKAELEAAQAKVLETRMAAWQTHADLLRAEQSDFDDTLAASNVTVTPAMNEAMMTSDLGPKVAYYLAKHPAEAKALLELSPHAQSREIGKIEAKVSAPPPPPSAPPPAKTGLPKPPKVIAGTSPAEIDLNTANMRQFRKEMEKLETL